MRLPLAVPAVLATLLLAPLATATGIVGTVDHACDAATGPLGAECALDCDSFASPQVRTACHAVDDPSVWSVCAAVFGPTRACDPDTYKCASMDPLLHAVCRDVINPALDRL